MANPKKFVNFRDACYIIISIKPQHEVLNDYFFPCTAQKKSRRPECETGGFAGWKSECQHEG